MPWWLPTPEPEPRVERWAAPGGSGVASTERRRLRRAVLFTFPVAFAVHDLEEILSAEAWGRSAPDRVRERFPRVPARMADALAVSTAQMSAAVMVVTVGVAAGTVVAWHRLDDDLWPLPAMLTAYTAHGATHLAQGVVFGGYTPGTATVPLVVGPYSLWAWRALDRAGLGREGREVRRDLLTGAVAAATLALVGQALGRLNVAARCSRPRTSGRRRTPQPAS